MIWVILRILFGAGLYWVVKLAWENGQINPVAGDLANAGYVAISVIFAIANAIVWAPYFGEKVSDPLTGVITGGVYVEPRNHLLSLILWLQDRGFRRLTVFFCFLEGIHFPNRPTAFVIGLNNAKPGSWFEKVYALEVFKFDNAQNCILAYKALKRHNINPGRHHNPEINLVFHSLEQAVKPEAPKLVVPMAAQPPALKRNNRIKLFSSADDGKEQVQEPQSLEPNVEELSLPPEPSSSHLDQDKELECIYSNSRGSGALAAFRMEWMGKVVAFLQGH